MGQLTEKDRNYWVIDWLSRHTAEQWHGIAAAWNWDDGVEPLHWIIQQDACDRATAALIFWNSEPTYFLGEDGADHPIAEMDSEIIARWKADRYETARFAFDPVSCDDYGEETEIDDLLPVTLAMAVQGNEDAPSYSYGLPPEIDAAWESANGIVQYALEEEEEEDHSAQCAIDDSVVANDIAPNPALSIADRMILSASGDDTDTDDYEVAPRLLHSVETMQPLSFMHAAIAEDDITQDAKTECTKGGTAALDDREMNNKPFPVVTHIESAAYKPHDAGTDSMDEDDDEIEDGMDDEAEEAFDAADLTTIGLRRNDKRGAMVAPPMPTEPELTTISYEAEISSRIRALRHGNLPVEEYNDTAQSGFMERIRSLIAR